VIFTFTYILWIGLNFYKLVLILLVDARLSILITMKINILKDKNILHININILKDKTYYEQYKYVLIHHNYNVKSKIL